MPMAMIEAGHGLARSLRDLGRLHEAREIAEETAHLEARIRNAPRRWGSAASILHGIEMSLGHPEVAVQAMRLDARTEPDPHYRISIHEVIAAWEARTAGARRADAVMAELDAARSNAALAGCPRCAAELSAVSIELLARVGRVDQARRELAVWESRSSGTYPQRELWRDRAKAAIAMASGEADEAIPILQGLARRLEEMGRLEDLLWTRIDLGRAIARIDRAGAVEAFTEAASLAERTGARSQGRLIASELRRLGVRAWRRGSAAGPSGLTALTSRELEVVNLVASGSSNREIADALVLSPKTVERHVTNALAKLGLRNRTELAAAVHSGVVRGSPDD
jgi:DNA-binding CsgD family transcriptional regulator